MDENSVAIKLEFIPCKTHTAVLSAWEYIHEDVEEQLKHTPLQKKDFFLNSLLQYDPTKFPFETLWLIFKDGRIIGFLHTRVEIYQSEPPEVWLHLINVFRRKGKYSYEEITKQGLEFLKAYTKNLKEIYNLPISKIKTHSSRPGAEKLYPKYGFKKGMIQYVYEVTE